MVFEVYSTSTDYYNDNIRYAETRCDNCGKVVTFSKNIDSQHNTLRTVGIKTLPYPCPQYTPETIKNIFDEASQCYSHNYFLASTAMLRLCLETVTKNLLVKEEDRQQNLYNRIELLFDTQHITKKLRDFANEIRLEGNIAVHEGTIDQNNLQDLFDFIIALLEELYTQPRKLELAREKRNQRKEQGKSS
ncbi:DUF4145 domain-containing protein [Commensalibacter oyaizuii]|uniref:DUF4145 domain-containing protein n=1 Tax=Commensalibacter oyaizuii TaxID=3043873 RepID=A0ABT6Q1B7_9PROT|nr:DUF4145 domain-containing protein [Commensalibacter sp. TBRC 16381]MDI2090907.1 DUF4145 domain-containing protein [Commensalibacter sp. TBRC 16381]